jgi:hypothetical protein
MFPQKELGGWSMPSSMLSITLHSRRDINPDYSAGKQRKVCSVGQPHDMVKEIDRYRG